jgi:hypothetical protein
MIKKKRTVVKTKIGQGMLINTLLLDNGTVHVIRLHNGQRAKYLFYRQVQNPCQNLSDENTPGSRTLYIDVSGSSPDRVRIELSILSSRATKAAAAHNPDVISLY